MRGEFGAPRCTGCIDCHKGHFRSSPGTCPNTWGPFPRMRGSGHSARAFRNRKTAIVTKLREAGGRGADSANWRRHEFGDRRAARELAMAGSLQPGKSRSSFAGRARRADPASSDGLFGGVGDRETAPRASWARYGPPTTAASVAQSRPHLLLRRCRHMEAEIRHSFRRPGAGVFPAGPSPRRFMSGPLTRKMVEGG